MIPPSLHALALLAALAFSFLLPQQASACRGDCDFNCQVTVDEILKLVNGGLGELPELAGRKERKELKELAGHKERKELKELAGRKERKELKELAGRKERKEGGAA